MSIRRRFSDIRYMLFLAAFCGALQAQVTLTGSSVYPNPNTGNACILPSGDIFSYFTTDPEVWVIYTYTGGTAGDQHFVEWFQPNGTIYRTYTYTQASSGGGYCYRWLIAIAAETAGTLPGNWHVRLRVNSTVIFDKAFLIGVPVTFATNPSGLQFGIIGDGTSVYTAPKTLPLLPGAPIGISVASPQSAGAGTQVLFTSWSDGGAQTHNITTPSSPTTYTANFGTTQYLLTTNVSPPGAGTVVPVGGYYNSGTPLQVSASANSGYQFSNWSGDLSGTSSSQSLTMNGPRNVTANFVAASVPVTIATNPSGLQINLNVGTNQIPRGTFTSPYTFSASAGSTQTISVTSPQGGNTTRSAFNGWSDGGAQTHTITVPASSVTYTANFKTQYALSTAPSPPGAGNITANPNSGDGFYDSGTPVQLSVSANSGFQFVNWSGDLSGGTSPQSVTMNAPRSVTANFTSAACGFGIAPTSATYGAAASSGNTVTVTPTANCGSWSSSSTVSWAVITSGNGTGTGNVTYNVLANTGSASRSTTLTIAGQPFTVTQAGLGCQFSFSPGTASYGVNGGSGSVNLSLSGSDCAWSAASNAPWVSITSGSSGQGTGSVNYQVSGNQASTVLRTGTITLTGPSSTATFIITEAGSTCLFSLPQGSRSFGPSGGTGTATVVATPGCAWTAASSGASFVTITGGSPGSGSGTVSYTVGANPSASPRTGTLTIAGQNYAVTQAAAGNNASCTAAVSSAPVVPLEGRTDLLGDLLVSCSGLTSAVNATISLTLNTDITNALSGASTLDAQLVNGGSSVNGQIFGYNTVQWTGVSIGPGTASLRITNVRADASLLAGGGNLQPAAITGIVSVNGGGLLPLSYAAQGGVGSCAAASNGLTLACATPTLSFQKGTASSIGGPQTVIPVVFAEDFAGAFTAGAGNGGPTRLRVVLNHVPSTVQIYAPIAPSEGLTAALYSADPSGAGGSPVPVDPNSGCTCAGVTVSGGTAVATWLVTSASPASVAQFTFPLLLKNATNSDLNAITIGGSLGPVSDVGVASTSAPIPRYRDFSVPLKLLTIRLVVRINSVGGNLTTTNTVTNESGDPTPPLKVGGNVNTPAGQQACIYPGDGALPSVPAGGSMSLTGSCGQAQGPATATGTVSSPDQAPVDPNETISTDSLNGGLQITLNSFPATVGLQVSVDGAAPVPFPQSYPWTPGDAHTIAVSSPQNLTAAGSRGVFANWSDGKAASHTITVPSASTEYDAMFTVQYLLSATPSPAAEGSVTVTQAVADGYYNAGSPVSLTATPSGGYQFKNWTVDGDTNSTNPLQLTMSNTHTVVAIFQATNPNNAPVTVTSTPPGLSVSVNGSACTTPCNFSFAAGTQVTIAAASQSGTPGTSYTFTGWSDGQAATHSITVPAGGATYTAAFTVFVTSTGGGPGVGGVAPGAGSGNAQTFTFQFTDSAGWQNLAVADILINNFLDGRNACYLAYVAASSTLVLVNDQGRAEGPYAGSVTLGSPAAIQNSQCAVGLISATGSGNTLSLTLAITFKPAFGGNRIQYLSAGDNSGGNTGWQAAGTWQVPFAPAGGIVVGAANPGRGGAPAGTAQTFTFTLTSNGDFGVVNLLANNFIDGRRACYLAYVASSNTLYLVDDAGDAGGPFAGSLTLNALGGGSGTIQNSQCSISAAGSSALQGIVLTNQTTPTSSTSSTVTVGGNLPGSNTLTLNLNITFKSAFAGNRILYVAGRDSADGNNTGWQAVGTWQVQ